MEHDSTEAASPEPSLIGGEFTLEQYNRMCEHLFKNVSQYVTRNPYSTNTRLFGFLALLNKYAPESYLVKSECQKVLGPPDPIHGGPPFEQRMEPFTQFIREATDDGHIYIHPVFVENALELMVTSGATRSTTVKNLMSSLCEDEPQPETLEFIKDLLTKREMGKKGKEKFSRLIQDICDQENYYNAISVLKTASNIIRQHPMFPQTLSRLYYIRNITRYYFERAQIWAHKAIERAPNNSFVADTLGQVYKNSLLRKGIHPGAISPIVDLAWQAFKDVEKKADKEVGPEMVEEAGALSITSTFNNRGRFGLIQVAKIAHEKRYQVNDPQQIYRGFLKEFRVEVEENFCFFEWYLTYSKPSKTSLEPSYFWKDVAVCYRTYTGASAADSISFPGLLECLNRGLFTSRGRYSRFVEVRETPPELELICRKLKTTHEANVEDDDAAERYILSNIVLSNREPNSVSLTPLTELQAILLSLLNKEAKNRSPEFYLLVLLLFWPQAIQEEDEEEVEVGKHSKTGDSSSDDETEDSSLHDETWENQETEQETEGESAQPSPEVNSEPDLQRYVTDMRTAFEMWYSRYLRGRYLVPLFFLGKGFGLSKWIHKSKLDEFVETEVDARLARENNGTHSPNGGTSRKWELINELWSTGQVWQIPAIQEILLPVMTDLSSLPTIPQEQQETRVSVFVGGMRILATAEFEFDVQAPTPFYLGFTIQGPVVFSSNVQKCACRERDG